MNICTITCHDVFNYGASLQAFALQHYLEMQGHQVKIIDYHPSYLQSYHFSLSVSKDSKYWSLYQKFPVLRFVKGLKDYLLSLPTRGRVKAFKSFNNKYLKLTDRYCDFSMLALNPPNADVYIAGSDQIWSTKLQNGIDPVFYMKFGLESIKRLSYAASFASPKVHYGYESYVKSLLTGIDAISVRESSGVDLLRNLGFNGVNVLDPVFLLSPNEWTDSLSIDMTTNSYGKYILVYDLAHNNSCMKKMVKELSSKYGLKIVAVNNKNTTSYADINVNDAGPIDFLKLLVNSQFVVADSFHATAFSVIFHKPFFIFFEGENVSRIKDFLDSIGLTDRLNPNCELNPIKWNIVDEKLMYQISISKDFLHHNIG